MKATGLIKLRTECVPVHLGLVSVSRLRGDTGAGIAVHCARCPQLGGLPQAHLDLGVGKVSLAREGLPGTYSASTLHNVPAAHLLGP